MNGEIAGSVLDGVTKEPLSTPKISLTRTGVIGETFTDLDELGRFAFKALSPGTYSLGFHSNAYAPLYRELILEEGASIDDLHIQLTPAAFLAGRILDENGLPPHHCHFTLITTGNRRGQSGYISDSGDHEVKGDGSFCSPPLNPGRYCLRFAGILQRPSDSASQSNCSAFQQRIFDFLYPNAQDVTEATFFELQIGQRINNIEIHIPRPIWRTLRGKLAGALPNDLTNIHVFSTRDIGMIDDFGSLGVKVNSLGVFEIPVQPGRYKLFVWEMKPPDERGHTRMTRELGSTHISVGDHDVDGFEIEL